MLPISVVFEVSTRRRKGVISAPGNNSRNKCTWYATSTGYGTQSVMILPLLGRKDSRASCNRAWSGKFGRS